MINSKRIRILRVVTSTECVAWHIGKTLKLLSKNFHIGVAGESVSSNSKQFENIEWYDVKISRKIHPISDLISLIRLCIVLHKFQPHITHSIMPKAGLITALAASLMRIPVRIHTFTGQIWDTKSGLLRALLKLIDKIIISLNTICLTDSPSQSKHLFDNGISYNDQPLPVLGSGSLIGVDLDRFDAPSISHRATTTRESLGIDKNDFVIAYIARKTRDKGAIDMLRGFHLAKSKCQNLHLLFIGPDESKNEIALLRHKEPWLFESVIERGPVSNHEEYLLASNLLCLPSYREGFGTIVLDAAALSIPTIGSRISGLIDSVADQSTGLLFPAGDFQKMSDMICMLSSDRAMLSQLGNEARLRVELNFSSVRMAHLLSEFYSEQFSLNKETN